MNVNFKSFMRMLRAIIGRLKNKLKTLEPLHYIARENTVISDSQQKDIFHCTIFINLKVLTWDFIFVNRLSQLILASTTNVSKSAEQSLSIILLSLSRDSTLSFKFPESDETCGSFEAFGLALSNNTMSSQWGVCGNISTGMALTGRNGAPLTLLDSLRVRL